MTRGGGYGSASPEEGSRAVPYVCPFCGEEDLRPAESGGWHCRSCLRLFSLSFHGLAAAQSSSVPPGRPRDDEEEGE
jgi:ribosomal protein L37AE/L43A